MSKIYKRDFDLLMRKIPSLSPKERQHLDDLFGGVVSNGMDSYELKEKIASLKYNQPDYGSETYLDAGELEALKQKVLEYLQQHGD